MAQLAALARPLKFSGFPRSFLFLSAQVWGHGPQPSGPQPSLLSWGPKFWYSDCKTSFFSTRSQKLGGRGTEIGIGTLKGKVKIASLRLRSERDRENTQS